MNREEAIRDTAQKIQQHLADQGKVMEGGWQAFEFLCGLQNAPTIQKREMRRAYFAGAQHLFAVLLNTLDSDREPTAADLNRVDLVHKELEAFVAQLKAQDWPRSPAPSAGDPPII